jgi:predicted dehydrogenase
MLKVGIAGYGVVGARRRECIEAHPDMQLLAVCDQKFTENGVFSDGVKYFNHYERMLDLSLDIIFVCLTNDVAANATMAGLQSGAHIFCEKPPGRNVEDIEMVMSVLKNNPNLKLMYGFNHRFHESVKDALKIFHSGELGSVINIRAMYGKAKLATFSQTDWRTKREVCGGGVLLDQGIHMVDLVRQFGGNFNTIYSIVSDRHWKYDVEDNAYALMKSDSGVVALLHSSATQWKHRFHLDVNLERGSLVLSGILSGTKSYGPETLTIVRADPDSDGGNPVEHRISYNKDNSWMDEVRIFADAVLNGSAIQNGTPEDALSAMKMVYGIYHADESWRSKYGILDPKVGI